MKNTIILIAICLSVVITTKAETEIEKEVKQLILDDNAYALKNLKDKAKVISNKGSSEKYNRRWSLIDENEKEAEMWWERD